MIHFAEQDNASASRPGRLPPELAFEILGEAADDVLITDQRLPDKPIIYANAAFAHITGYSVAEVLGRNCRFLQGDEQQQREVALIRGAITAGRSVTVTLRNYRRDGSLFWNEVRLAPLGPWDGPDGSPRHYVGFQRDVTDQVEDAAALQRALQDAEEANAAKLRFLAVMGHEFRTPIALILGFADLLLADAEGKGAAQQVEYLTDIRLAGHHLLSLAEDARRYAQVAELCELSDRKPISLGQLLADAAHQAEAIHGGAGTTLRWGIIQEVPPLCADTALLRHAMLNLLHEMARRAPAEAVIELCGWPEGDQACVELCCRELVLPHDAAARMLAPLAVAEGIHSRGWEGGGIAVSLAKRVIQLHGGSLRIRSSLDDGTCFQILLPVKRPSVPTTS
ncbi:sensor histidine kinase [Teichococcus vastitatis]|uniref:histidine kinase n=1 Tax=Teichococcus vastitatis TaxID=2307076 RepID=A0ABS9W923_9PROT|nr:PAS domain-containing protein [Pseudoroseomonas vastitatis]MCI0755806.1 PAS domain-containing protein [Pseudoroseomonas vastitatis]